jgi:hypothetical protein
MAINFDSVERKSGDLYLVQTSNGTLIVGDSVEELGFDHYRVSFAFKEGMVFESSVDCKSKEIRQVIRNGVAIWFNRV